jgi:hypothetical protein
MLIMEKRKIVFAGIFGALLVSLLAQVVSAYGFYFGGPGMLIDSMVRTWEPLLQALLGGFGWSGMYLFERLLLFILLLTLIYLILGKVPLFEKQKATKWVVAVIVPLIGIRYIDYAWLSSIIMQYRFLAIILTSILPFILFFFFIYNLGWDYPMLRKAGWIMFIGVYIGLWSTVGAEDSPIYLWTLVAGLVCLIGDGRIERYYRIRQYASQDQWQRQTQVAEIEKQIQEMIKNKNNYPDQRMWAKKLKELQNLKHDMIKQIS